MIKIFKTFDGVMKEIDEKEDGCWISLTNPTESELIKVAQENNIDIADIKAAMDEEERSRIQPEDDYTMILVDVPTIEERNEKDWYVTIPMSIILTNNLIITVCLEETPLIKSFMQARVKNFHTHMKTRFILQILYRNATLYLQYLRNINRKSEEVEKKLHRSTKNSELIELLELEKSLVYFTTSLRSNEIVLEKLLRTEKVKQYPEDTDLLEDTIIENKQAMEMANIYSGILSGMMDAFASVISNNLNIVMKFLATITIVLSIPTMIFSAYGMNVNGNGMPFANSVFGFGIVIAFAIVISLLVALIFSKKDLF
ncbi:MAG: magnesium transporter CorA family protein [Lachnospiraceae bacterium]|nr:magnesium transporter CorA family protein [Lachnospiraceae bacterium]